ncbi:hypothetical protein EF847_13875 [Actinobacteria bacterium YIM 96077]|uniref:Tetratricopeptide repeat protein n=1 Tax=Phytoactinopolyspora halophila TaxID=1981511 RepID=A0A329QH98_9ACTN|nr:hypothetical protein [Phytoactinopolyspora halophila]AYY13622.1 hypothetical protein EF847_13875 [Actinobacteria bacterium YIM 96077]RAW10712.1 hypothetical protein DPM12_18445 [Phytoactinopolyspora halophila]
MSENQNEPPHGKGKRPESGRSRPGERGRRDGARGGRDDSGGPRGNGRGRPRPGEERRRGDASAPRGGRGEQTREKKADEPVIDEDVTGDELDEHVRAELRGLPGGVAKTVARHLVMAGTLLEEDPETAYAHARTARRKAARIGIVREAAGIAAYRAGRYSDALAELRAARRMTGSAEYLPMMADCERGLGRPVRALDLASDPAVTALDTASRMEMLIVAAGARRDLGEHAAAAAMLQVPELRSQSTEPWIARLRYAYADALAASGREREAHRWFLRAAEADADAETDAAERAAQLAPSG